MSYHETLDCDLIRTMYADACVRITASCPDARFRFKNNGRCNEDINVLGEKHDEFCLTFDEGDDVDSAFETLMEFSSRSAFTPRCEGSNSFSFRESISSVAGCLTCFAWKSSELFMGEC